MTVDDITLVLLFLVPWPIFGVWELVALWLRKRGRNVRLISQVAKDNPYCLSAVAYLDASMPAHWWWNAGAWGPTWTGYVYWALPVMLLAWTIATWRSDPAIWPQWQRVVRHPILWVFLGPLAGRYLFPQRGLLPWQIGG